MSRLGVGYGSIGGEAEDLLRELSVSGEEIIGEDEYGVVGDDDGEIDLMGAEEIIGAMPPSRAKLAAQRKLQLARAKKLRAQKAAQYARAGTQIDVVPQVNRRHRLMVAGMGFTTVLLGATATITITPQRLFKPKLMSIPGSIAVFFSINAVFVGQDSQLAAAGGIPAECFSETAVNAPIDWDTANIGNTITIQVTNIEPAGGAASRIFSGMLIGLGVKP